MNNNRYVEVRDIIVCPECGHTVFDAEVKCQVSVKFYIDNNLIYPKTDIVDIDDDTITNIECINCNHTLATNMKDLKNLIKHYKEELCQINFNTFILKK